MSATSPDDTNPSSTTPPTDAENGHAAPGARGEPHPSAESPRTAEEIEDALDRIEDELELLRGEPSAEAIEVSTKLARLELEYLRLAREAERVSDDFVSQAGNPVLDDLADWSHAARLYQLDDATAAVQTVSEGVFVDVLDAWQHRSDTDEIAAHRIDLFFERLMEITSLELAAIEISTLDPPGLELLHAERSRWRNAFAATLRLRKPSDEELERWKIELLDRADTLLTSVDEMPPAAASLRLTLALDDIDWHLRSVERRTTSRWQLARKRYRLYVERQERELLARRQRIFGVNWVARWERLIFVLIFALLGLMIVQTVFEETLTFETLLWLEIADAACCVILLTDFFTKLALARDRWLWFRRNFIFGLLPSIPFGLILLLMPHHALLADGLRAGILGRILQLPRLARYIQVLRPLVRLLRFFGFLLRGIDRLARRLGPALNRNIILYPNRAERQAAKHDEHLLLQQVQRIRAHLVARWHHVLGAALREDRSAVAHARLATFTEARSQGWTQRPPRRDVRAAIARELPAEELLRWMLSITPQDVGTYLGEDVVDRLARFVRLMARPPVSWLPLVSSVVPRLNTRMSDAETVAAAARSLAAALRRHQAWRFVGADLYGTLIPSQFVDQVGVLLIKSSLRPVYRLLLFGGLFVGLSFVLTLLPFEPTEIFEGWLHSYVHGLNNLIGSTLAVVGVICIFTLALGFWMRRLAREATEFYERSVSAQFLSLTETIRCRTIARDAEILYHRVLEPETLIHERHTPARAREELDELIARVRQSLVGVVALGDSRLAFDSAERALLLFRDSLDGAILTEDDARTTYQLLGNPALQQALASSERRDYPTVRDLEALDLGRLKSLFGGPYLWFNFISRAISQSVARLIIDYNRHALPLRELALAVPFERERFTHWLARTRMPKAALNRELRKLQSDYVTTFFTSMHFLDADPVRDQEVLDRFGPEVHERLLRDRSLLFRTIFGCYPLHNRPKEQRVFNPFRFYETWLSGGQAILLPWFALRQGVIQGWRLLVWIWKCVQEIRDPRLRVDTTDAADADFTTAMRKIERMRGPIVFATMCLRAKFDPEYLGVPIPHLEHSTIAAGTLDRDLAFVDADPKLLEHLDAEQERAEADMERLGALFRGGLLQRVSDHLDRDETPTTPEQVRATAVAYLADMHGVRRLLSARAILQEVYDRVAGDEPLPPRPWPALRLGHYFRKYWAQYGRSEPEIRKAAWRATVHNIWGAADALLVWGRYGDLAPHEGERRLTMLLRHPSRISEQLVTLRSVQTLAMLDVLVYREHIYRVGEYEAQGDDPSELFAWAQSQSGLLDG